MEAESIWDSVLSVAGDLDLTVGGKSFQIRSADTKKGAAAQSASDLRTNRRGAYMTRGYVASTDVMPNFLLTFDVDDGRTPCPMRTQTVTAPQSLFTMNDDLIETESAKFADRMIEESGGELGNAVKLAYTEALGREPSGSELDQSLTYLKGDPARMKGLAWLLFNLDEFIYVR
jgi:hypothetical protein